MSIAALSFVCEDVVMDDKVYVPDRDRVAVVDDHPALEIAPGFAEATRPDGVDDAPQNGLATILGSV
jgi:hypothetical protein